MWGELASAFQAGNMYVLIMLALGFIITAIVIERLIMLHGVYNVNIPKFLKEVRKMVEAQDHDRARNYCKTVSQTSVPKIALAALEAHSQDPATVKGHLEESTIEFLPKIETRLSLMPAIATLVLLVGVLGTIDGLWGAFHSIDVLDTAKKQASLANGIAGSLTPTALGLLISMLGLAAHHFTKGVAISLTERVHYGVTVLHNLLVPQEVAVAAFAGAGMMAQAPMENPSAMDDDGQDDDDDEEEDDDDEDTFDDAAIDDIKDEEEII
ncbi:MotA/TolQ/ExbB proton channel family protein [bacterium]|nr:MotA/TolQ/ExbB proton channel family protein [bacterium]